MTAQMKTGSVRIGAAAIGATVALMLASPLAAQSHDHDSGRVPAALVQIVREATLPYRDVNVATSTDTAPRSGVSADRRKGRWASTTSMAHSSATAR